MVQTPMSILKKGAPPGQPDVAEVRITNSPHWKRGDFTLISADNVRFKTMKYHLASGSKVFADMFSGPLMGVGYPNVIQFPDPEIETAAAIDIFLALVTGSFGKTHHSLRENNILIAIRFLNKYDCRGLKNHLAAQVVKLTEPMNFPYHSLYQQEIQWIYPNAGLSTCLYQTAYVIGAALEDPLLLVHAICRLYADNPKDGTFKASAPTAAFDSRLPDKYSFALWTIYHYRQSGVVPMLRMRTTFMRALGYFELNNGLVNPTWRTVPHFPF